MLDFIIYIGISTFIYSILAISLNLQLGFTGLVNFGQVLFLFTGAYASALLAKAGFPFILCFLGGVVISGAVGFLVSLTTGNLSGTYWAICTLGFAEIARIFALNEPQITGGALGIRGIPRCPISPFLLSLLCLAGVYIISELLVRSPFGRIMKTVREDENLAEALGKSVSKVKVQTLILAAMIGGSSGVIYAHYFTYIDPLAFMPIETFIVWAMVIAGGTGNNFGVIVGTLLIQLLYIGSRFLSLPLPSWKIGNLRMIIIGLLIVLIMMFRKEGLLKERMRRYPILKERDSAR